MTSVPIVAIIGFGEVGGIFARDLRKAGIERIVAYDPHFADAQSANVKAAREHGVKICASAAEAAGQAEIVICAVTAGSALEAAEQTATGIPKGAMFVDVNSVSPATKRDAAGVIEAAGGRYVEAAVMTSVPPQGLASPMLLGGSHTADFVAFGAPLGMKLTPYAVEIGQASAVKMCRSVMIKGLEALVTECMLSARHYGVEKDVLASLSDTLPHEDWPKLARYMMGRSLQHGKRRAEEMREVARTVRDAGIDPLLAAPTAERQDWAYNQGKAVAKEAVAAGDLPSLLDGMLALRARPAGEDPAMPFRIHKIGHVVLNTTDLDRSVRFYTEVLGFKVSDVYPSSMVPGGMVFMRCNSDHHGIALVGSPRDSFENVELHHIAFEVDTLDEVLLARDHLAKRQVKVDFEGRRRAGAQIAVEFRDPDGHRLEIYWGVDQVEWSGTTRPAEEWKWAHSLKEAIADPVRGQNTRLKNPSLLDADA